MRKKINFLENIHLLLIYRITITMLIFSLSRIVFYFYNTDYYQDMTFMHFLSLMLDGLRFDISAVLYTNLLFILFQILPFQFKHNFIYQKVLIVLYYITNSIIILANSADIAYYQFTLKRTSSTVFEQFGHESNLGKLFFRFLWDFWPITFFAIASILILVFLNKNKLKTTIFIQNKWKYFIANLIIAAVVIGLTVAGLRGGFGSTIRPINMSDASRKIKQTNERAIVLNTPFSIYRTITSKGLKKKNYFTKDEISKIYSAEHKADTTNSFQNKNVVIFILESFGREHIGALNKDIPGAPGFTPFLDSLISISYTYRYAFANGRKSISAIPSVLASTPSLVNPYILSPYSGNKLNSFANTLARKGYYSAFFHGAADNSMGFNAFTTHIGINNYFGKDEYGNDDDYDGYWGIWDEEFFQFFAKKMDSFKQPFFSAIFSVSSHHPYGIPKRYEGKFPEGKLKLQRTIGYSDYALKRFFKTASKMPWFKNTIFVLTADHAATYSDLPEYKTPSGYFAVPVIIYEPSTENWKGFNDTTVVQQIDIMPTILDYLKYDKNYIAFGTNMRDTTKTHFSVSYLDGIYQVAMSDYIFQFNEDKLERMFNIKTDKLQKNNIVGQFPEIEAKALKHLQAFRQEYNNRMIENKTYEE